MAEEPNQRVTNAILSIQLDHIDKKLDAAIAVMTSNTMRVVEVEKCIALLISQCDDLDKRSQKWDIANSALGLALMSVLAYFGLRSQ